MEYRRLGTAGLKVSVLSFGSWVTFDTQLDNDLALDCMQTAWDAGVNFFDNAEAYAGGQSETIMGRAFAELGWPRNSYVVSTKFYWGLADGPNTRLTLNRKYLLSAIEASLERMGLEYVDLAFCHRSDPDTPMEEVVWAMHDMIERGQALYWGTSEWSAQEIRSAFEVAERLGLRPPVTEQPQYNMLNRDRLEAEYAPLFDDFGIGTTIWSPLASGLLTGKYLDGIPNDSRAALDGYEWIKEMVTAEDAMVKVRNLVPIADRLGCSMAQLAIAWAAKNPNVSTVITGASRASQVRENMAAMEVLSAIDAEVMAEVQAVLG